MIKFLNFRHDLTENCIYVLYEDRYDYLVYDFNAIYDSVHDENMTSNFHILIDVIKESIQ